MALSQSVSDSLKEAESHIRNALSYASRQERPSTCAAIAKLMTDIENVKGIDEILDRLDEANLKNFNNQ